MAPRSPQTHTRGVRRLAYHHGWTADAIARVYGLPVGAIRSILASPSRQPGPRRPQLASTDPDRPIHGGLATSIRRRSARGESAEAIGRHLSLRASAVAAYLADLEARAGRLAWMGPDDDVDAELPALPELPQLEPAISAAEVPQLPGPAGDWASFHASAVAGERAPNARLTDADAELVRQLRADGVPRAEVAARLGVSVATITRITRGDTYRPVAGDDQVVLPDPPAIAPAEVPRPAVWMEPERPGAEWRDD